MLVNDIESYPSYMDGCVGAQILKREGPIIDARLELSRGGIEQSFATRNHAHEFHTIELELLEGPFDSLSGAWKFQGLGDMACKISLDLEFSLKNSVLGLAAGKLFDSVTHNLVDAVSRRANQLYR